MSATAGTLTLIVDSSSVSDGERALDSIARTGARVEGSLKIDMGSIEKAMARLGQQVTSLDSTMTAGMGRVTAASHAQAKTFDQLRASIDPAYATTMRFKEVQQQLAVMVSSGEASQRAANIVLEQAASRYMGVATAAERAAEAERQAAQASATASQNYEALRASVDPLFATSKRYEAALETLTAAQKAGAISDSERTRTLQLIEARLIGAGQSATAATGRFSKLFASVGGGQMALRQTAFQLNQVAQQGAVTGNYMQALTVQSADLLTVFGLWGILAGGAIAVMGPLATSLFATSKDAEKAKNEIGDLSMVIDRLGTVSQVTSGDLSRYLGSAFGDVSDKVQALIDDLRDAEFSVISSKVQREIEASSRSLTELEGAWEVFAKSLQEGAKIDQNYLNQRIEIIRRSKIDLQDFLSLQKEVKDVYAATSVDAFVKELAEAYALADDLGGPVGEQVAQSLLSAAKEGGLLNRVIASAAGSANGLGVEVDAAADALLNAANNALALQQSLASLSIPFADAMEELDFELSTSAMSAADKLVATRVRRLEETMRSASERVFGFDYGLTSEQEAQLAEFEKTLRGSASQLTKTAKAGARAAKETERQLDAIRASIDPFHSYNKKMKELVALKQHLSDDEMAMAIKNLNMELADSLPLVGELSDAIAGAIVAGDSLSDAFANVLRQMAQDALSSGIKAILTDQLTPGTGGGGFFGTILGGLLGKAGATEAEAVTQMAGSTKKTDWFNPPLIANSTDIPKSFKPQTVNNTSSNQTVLTVVVDVTGANGDEAVKKIAEEATRKGIEQAAPKLIGQSVDATYERSAEYPLGKRYK